MPDKSAERRFDPMDIANPVSAYFFLSSDARDEISGATGKSSHASLVGISLWARDTTIAQSVSA